MILKNAWHTEMLSEIKCDTKTSTTRNKTLSEWNWMLPNGFRVFFFHRVWLFRIVYSTTALIILEYAAGNMLREYKTHTHNQCYTIYTFDTSFVFSAICNWFTSECHFSVSLYSLPHQRQQTHSVWYLPRK